jgi:short-subunit dehydrogenase
LPSIRNKQVAMTSEMRDPNSILITGASSGIGAALAKAYAAPGVSLALTGRDAGRLAKVAEACREAGAETHEAAIDVLESESLSDWMTQVDSVAPLDLAIANAGISAGTGGGGEDLDQARRIMAINVDGVVTTLMAAGELMRRRGRGQLAIMSSLAGFRGFPGAPAYCASKAAVRIWGESLRGSLHGEGIGVSVICPGYVRTPMTGVNAFPMPFLMEADQAARIIRRGLARNRARIAFPLRLYAFVWLLGVLPPALTDPLLRRLPAKD